MAGLAALALAAAGLVNVLAPPSSALTRSPVLMQGQASFQDVISPSNLSNLLKFEVGLLGIPVVIGLVADTRRRCNRLASLFALSAVVNAVVALVQYATARPNPYQASPRVSGLAVQPNHLALTCAMAIPIVMLWMRHSARGRALALGAVSLLLGAVYVSGSRAGAVGALLALFATVVLVPGLWKLLVAVPLIGIAVVLLLALTDAGSQIIQQVRLNAGNRTAVLSNAREPARSRSHSSRSVRGLSRALVSKPTSPRMMSI